MKRIICLCLIALMLLSLTSCALDSEFNSMKSKSKATDSDKKTVVSGNKEPTEVIEYIITNDSGVEYYFYVYGDSFVLRAINITSDFKGNYISLPEIAPNGTAIDGYHINSFYNSLPTMMPVGDFEKLLSNKELAEFEKNQLISFYALKDLEQHLQKYSDPQKREEESKAFIEKYPMTAYTPVYVFNGITPKEYQTVEDIFERLGYTYEHHLDIATRLLKEADGDKKALESVNIPSYLNLLENAEQLTIPTSARELTLRIANAPSLKKITLPETVEKTDGFIFHGCSSLKSFEFPEGVETIDNDAFHGCEKLESVALPDGLLNIGNRAFKECVKLSGITIPDSVTSIGSSAFSGCSALTEVTVPVGVKSIEAATFSNCSSLVTVYLPETVNYIGDSAFQFCTSLECINFDADYGRWTLMGRGLNWYDNTGEFIVRCIGKEVSKEDANWPIEENIG